MEGISKIEEAFIEEDIRFSNAFSLIEQYLENASLMKALFAPSKEERETIRMMIDLLFFHISGYNVFMDVFDKVDVEGWKEVIERSEKRLVDTVCNYKDNLYIKKLAVLGLLSFSLLSKEFFKEFMNE